jgi:hypothetical protein
MQNKKVYYHFPCIQVQLTILQNLVGLPQLDQEF